METWDAIRSRRNVRSYGEQTIAPQDLDRILEAGRRAPSAGNQQAWDFVVCTDPGQLAQLARVGPAAGHVAGSAATIALVAPSSDDAQLRDLIQFDLEYAEDLARRRFEDRSGWISSRMGRRVGSRRPTGLPPSALRPPP